MKKSTGIIDFVKDYINNKRITSSHESYESWLRENGIDSQSIYDATVKDAKTDYEKAKAEYGSIAESLAETGLSKSGYSDYVNSKAYSEYQKRKQGALSDYTQNEAHNKSSYASYLDKLSKEKDTLYKNTEKEIIDKNILDFNDAYDYAIGLGIDVDDASKIAKRSTDYTRNQLKTEIGKLVISSKLSKSEARAYALFRGLSEKEADEISDFASEYSDYFTRPTGTSYLEYLKEMLK